MKRLAITILLLAATSAQSQDTVTFKTGKTADCLITAYSDGAFTVVIDSETKQAPIQNIQSVSFGPKGATSQTVAPITSSPISVVAKKLSLQKGLTPEARKEWADSGMQLLAVAVVVSSTRQEPLEVKHDYFSLSDADGIEYKPSSWGLDMLEEITATSIKTGETTGGWVGFTVPVSTDLTTLKIRYQNNDMKSAWAPVPKAK